jgi:hypothetical protein
LRDRRQPAKSNGQQERSFKTFTSCREVAVSIVLKFLDDRRRHELPACPIHFDLAEDRIYGLEQ